MSYIWENYSIDNTYKLALKNYCPYTEVFEMVNGTAKVNIVYRFFKVYTYLFEGIETEEQLMKIFKEEDFNMIFHILANIDMYSGLSLKDIEMLKIYLDICNGLYGINPEYFEHMEFEHKYKLLSYIHLRQEQQNCNNYFFDCLSELFPIQVYFSENKDTYIVQIWNDENKVFSATKEYTAKELYECTKYLLCDYWINVEVYWKIPIGICGDVMKVDNIQLI